MKSNTSRVMKMAHILYANKPGFQWADIVRHAWYFEHFRQWLAEGLVEFTYLKRDNSIRDARGTLNEHLIPLEDRPKGSKPRVVHYEIVTYYDIDRKAWRSFDIRLFVGYVERYPIQKKADKRKEAKEN